MHETYSLLLRFVKWMLHFAKKTPFKEHFSILFEILFGKKRKMS